jgi:DNA-binding response OmpR family regulator
MRVAHVLRVARTNPRLTNPAHVLVVEDDAGLRETLSSVLRDAGLACSTAPDGAAALEECQRSDPDLVILDLALPVLDGARFADAYRRIPGSGARILVISGIDRGAETASRLRADAFLSKPFGLDQLLAMAQRLLGLRAA